MLLNQKRFNKRNRDARVNLRKSYSGFKNKRSKFPKIIPGKVKFTLKWIEKTKNKKLNFEESVKKYENDQKEYLKNLKIQQEKKESKKQKKQQILKDKLASSNRTYDKNYKKNEKNI